MFLIIFILSINDFKIIGSDKFVYDICILESLFIYKLKPKPNDTQSACLYPLCIVCQWIDMYFDPCRVHVNILLYSIFISFFFYNSCMQKKLFLGSIFTIDGYLFVLLVCFMQNF